MRVSELREEGEAMNVPEKLEVPVVVKDTDGNEHEVERFVYRLERNGKSRWHELFGTPERAAQTFEDFCDKCDKGECNDCPLDRLTNFCIGYDALLEWLRGESDGK